MQTNRSKSARCISIVIDYYSTWCFVSVCFSIQIQMYSVLLWHTMRAFLEFVLPILLVETHFPFRCCVCVCVSSYGTSRKKPHFSIANCYYLFATLLPYCDFCDTILFFILIIYLLLFCQSSATLSEQIYVFQWNLFFSIPFQAIHMCSFSLSLSSSKILRCVTL